MNNENNEKIIKNFLEEMSKQYPRGTAFPYYYVIIDYRLISAANGCGNFVEYISKDCDYSYSEKEYKQELKEGNIEPGDFCEIYMQEIEFEKGMFLTESDAQNHLEANRHHYSKKAHTYVKHCFRATELIQFLTILFEYFDVPIPPKMYYEEKNKKGS